MYQIATPTPALELALGLFVSTNRTVCGAAHPRRAASGPSNPSAVFALQPIPLPDPLPLQLNESKTGANTGTIEDAYNTGLKPSIKLTKAPESYGDGNVIMFFNWNKDLSQITSWNSDGTDQRNAWEKTGVGIYQGEINAKAKIGEYLNLEQAENKPNASDTQTMPGNTLYDNKYVENNVGIFARSGQRE